MEASAIAITNQEFAQFQKLLYEVAGISLSESKKPLVCGRLSKRLRFHRFSSFGEYFRFLISNRESGELQVALDLLTTNETYFFREIKHFNFLQEKILPLVQPTRPFRVWSAACSSGEEPYSIAMVLAERLSGGRWEIVGSDLSTQVLEKARSGHYPIAQAKDIPKPYLIKYCLKGVGAQQGTFRIQHTLCSRIGFRQINLNAPLPNLGEFDVVFLRNVMIYFDMKTKQQVVGRIVSLLRRGGYLFVGHSESLNGIASELETVMPSIYRKP